MIDSALWTGRTWEWKWWRGFNCQGLLLTLIRCERDAREGARLPAYGVQLGTHWQNDCYGVTLYWNMVEWRWISSRRPPWRN